MLNKYTIKDVDFVKCQEYDPYNPKADSLGLHYFWRADLCGETIATACETKAECMKKVREYLRSLR